MRQATAQQLCAADVTRVLGRAVRWWRRAADYMLSNNHVNNLITAVIDPTNDELLSFYISFLKTMSLQLTEETVQFFYNGVRKPHLICAASSRVSHGSVLTAPVAHLQRAPRNKFPLYTEAIKYSRHENRMVRIAVRAITLSVYRSTCRHRSAACRCGCAHATVLRAAQYPTHRCAGIC